MKKHLVASDLYICTSKFEASPVAVWEAMSVGLPVISTDVGDLKRANDIFDCCLIVEKREATIFASQIVSLLKSRATMQTLGQNGLDFVSSTKNISTISKKTIEAYRFAEKT